MTAAPSDRHKGARPPSRPAGSFQVPARTGPILELILDGWGDRPEAEYNCCAFARTRFLDYVTGRAQRADEEIERAIGPTGYTTLTAVGPAVGMPEGAKGSTAVGHEVLSGVRYEHPMLQVERAMPDGVMRNPVIDELCDHVVAHGSRLHLVGMVSNNREHSHIQHLYAILRVAAERGVERVVLHFISDGRGTPPFSAPRFVEDLEDRIEEIVATHPRIRITVATIMGRDIAMNRSSATWYKTEAAYRAIVEGEAERTRTVVDALRAEYARGVNDQYVTPRVIGGYRGLSDHDGLLHWNFRKDRAEFLMRMLLDPIDELSERLRSSGDADYATLDRFRRLTVTPELDLTTVRVAALVEFYQGIPCPVAFRPPPQDWSLGAFLSHFGFRQVRISGVDKAKAVALLSGGEREELYEGEERVVVPMPRDMQDYMRAYDEKKGEPGFTQDPYARFPLVELRELTRAVLETVDAADARTCIMVNLCNPDMVGHTADIMAGITAMEEVDHAVQKCVVATVQRGGVCFITADHGNIEEMLTEDGEPSTFHTAADVSFVIAGAGPVPLRAGGSLRDVAPTLLYFALGEEAPEVRRAFPGRVLVEGAATDE